MTITDIVIPEECSYSSTRMRSSDSYDEQSWSQNQTKSRYSKPSGKKKRKIYIDGEYTFSLYAGEIRKYELVKDQPVSKELVDLIFEECILKRAKLRAMHLLEKRDYTVSAISDKLKQSEYNDDTIQQVVTYLESYGYLDDVRYAKQFISFKKGSCSRFQLTQKLMQKGIAKDDIDRAYLEYEELEENNLSEQEDEALQKQLDKRLKRYDIHAMEQSDWNKVYQFLARKGFSSEKISRAIRLRKES